MPARDRPGIASAAVPRPNTADTPVSAARGGSRSAADSSAVAPASWAIDGPNIASADSSGDRVDE